MNFCPHAAVVALALINTMPASAEIAPAPSAFGSKSESVMNSKPPLQPVQPLLPAARAVPQATTLDNKKTSFPALAASGGAERGAFDVKANKSRSNLFDMDDRAIIIVSGRQSTAGAIKKSILAEIDKHNPTPQTISAARKVAMPDIHPEQRDASPPPAVNPAVMGQATLRAKRAAAATGGMPALSTPSRIVLPDPTQVPTVPPAPQPENSTRKRGHQLFREVTCADSGPPAISEIKGTFKPGQTVLLQGSCFGDRAGHISIGSQYFLGGRLRVAPLAWNMNEIKLVVPSNISGVPDHSTYITVATADSKTSSPQTARFIALREHINVPSRLWQPTFTIKDIDTKSFDENELPRAQAYEKSLRDNPSQGDGGHGRNGSSSFLLQVNEHCALDTFNVATPRGRVRAISGWDAGPAYMSNVKVDWRSTCTQITKEQNYFFTADLTFVYACAVEFQVAATASCPVGIPIDRVSLKSQGAPPRLR